jgi:anti-sigma-K factor RskA
VVDREREIESNEERLARLARATEGLTPRADLAARLAAPYRAGRRPRRRIEALVLPWGRSALAVAALAAAAAVALAFQVERGADEALLRLDESAGWEP